MRPSVVLPTVVVVAVALLGAGCRSDDATSKAAPSTPVQETTTSTVAETATTSTGPASVSMGGQTVTTARLLAVADGLCEAAQQAATDVDAARRTFQGRSHDGLHLIARGLEDIDRAASATLLEAKQKVEADFAKPPAATQLVADLRQLSEVTRSSLVRFNVSAPACPPAS